MFSPSREEEDSLFEKVLFQRSTSAPLTTSGFGSSHHLRVGDSLLSDSDSLSDIKSITSLYSKSKLLGEKVVREQFPNCVILRPSVVFGKRDNFTNFFLSMSNFSPFLPVIGTPEIKKKV